MGKFKGSKLEENILFYSVATAVILVPSILVMAVIDMFK